MLSSKRQQLVHIRHDKTDVSHLSVALCCFLPVSRIVMFSYFSCQHLIDLLVPCSSSCSAVIEDRGPEVLGVLNLELPWIYKMSE